MHFQPFACEIQEQCILSLAAVAVLVNAIQRLEHDHSITADHAHAQADFLVVGLALGGFVEDDVEEHVVAAQGAHNFARAVELHFDALVEVLWRRILVSHLYHSCFWASWGHRIAVWAL